MNKIIKPLLIITILLAVLSGVISCSKTPLPAQNDEEIAAIRAYADPTTQTTLEGLSETNLAKYTQYGNSQFKAAVTQDILNQASSQINSQFGSFVSITFLRTEKQSNYNIVHYKATYTNGSVGVRMVFDTDHLVAGQWFEPVQ